MSDDSANWYDPEITTFGDRLTGAREAAGLSQPQLADRLGVARGTLAAWEEDRSEPRSNRLATLAGMLNVSVAWLLTGTGDGVAEPGTAAPEALKAALADLRELQAGFRAGAERAERIEARLRQLLEPQEPA